MAQQTADGATVAPDVIMPDVHTATFDVDESLAALVLSHVTNTRDRLALAYVSRVWRKVAATEGCWGTCDLVIDRDMLNRLKLTNERLECLIGYCGDVKNLEIRNAPMLQGKCLYKDTLLVAKKLPHLRR